MNTHKYILLVTELWYIPRTDELHNHFGLFVFLVYLWFIIPIDFVDIRDGGQIVVDFVW